MAPKFRVLAPDAYGSGNSPEWPSDRVIRLQDEVALIEPVLARAESPLDAETPSPNEADGIRNAVAAAGAALDAGNTDAAAECFIDYWMGPGSWRQMPEQRKPAIAASVVNVRRWSHALFTEPAPLAALRALDIPVLLMVGRRSTPSARGVARLLAATLPRVEVMAFDELGHMGPLTHPELVNTAIERFLEQAWRDARPRE